MKWYLQALKRYARFSGRARRREYWLYMLVFWAVFLAIIMPSVMHDAPGEATSPAAEAVASGWILFHLIPGIAVTVRRLHDTGRSGMWYFVGGVPLIGWLILLFFLLQDGVSSNTVYGADPKGKPKPTFQDMPQIYQGS